MQRQGWRSGVVVAAGVAAVWLGACVEPATQVCGDVVCPLNLVCAPSGDGCAEPAQVAACEGVAPGEVCDLPGVGMGRCRDELCVVAGCGDGRVDAGEACDDGDANGPDAACLPDCKRPTCGDEAIQGDEACDDGEANGEDRACLPTCVAASCGDGRVWLGAGSSEQCDAGVGNVDDGACTTSCQLATCGDGHVWAGVEVCDDGNAASGDGCRADCRKVETCGDALVDAGEACDDGNGNAADGCDACVPTTWGAEALLRGAVVGTAVGLASPGGVAVDRSGNVFIADTLAHRIRRVDAMTGDLTTLAGTGAVAFAGDGGPATSAVLSQPQCVAVDGLGNVYVADTGNNRVRRVDAATGVITTIAGTGVSGFSGDGGPAVSASLAYPQGVAVDGLGNIFVADTNNQRIRRVDAITGVISTVAGTGTFGFAGDGGAAAGARLAYPQGVAVDGLGNLFIADSNNHRLRRVDAATSVITTAAGDGANGFAGDDGAATSASLGAPRGVALDAAGNLYIADTGNQRIRRVDGGSGVITTVAGTGGAGFVGDGGPAANAGLWNPQGVAIDVLGNAYIADTANSRIRRVDATADVISTIAGTGAGGFASDGGPATSAQLAGPQGLAMDALANLYIADAAGHGVRRTDAATGVITTVAGTGAPGFAGDGGPAVGASLWNPQGAALDASGNLYIADTSNQRIRRVDAATAVITTVAGSGVYGFTGDGGVATGASFRSPGGVALDGAGNLYIADTNNHRVRRVDATTAVVTTVAGTGVVGFTGDGGAAASARLAYPYGVAVDGQGNLYIADTNNQRIRRVDSASGVIATVAGNGTATFAGDGMPAVSASLSYPEGVALDALGNVHIADTSNGRLRVVDAVSGIISTVAGTGSAGFTGDGGPAAGASLYRPQGVAVDALGNRYFTDAALHGVRRVDASTAAVRTVVGALWPSGEGPADQAVAATPQALWSVNGRTWLATGARGVVQELRLEARELRTVAGRYPHAFATGDRALYRAQSFGSVGGVAYDEVTQRIFLAEGHVVHAVTTADAGAGVDPDDATTWTIAVFAGAAGVAGSVDGGLASARFRSPTGLYFDEAARVLYVVDTGNHTIRAIDVDGGTVTSVAGTPTTLGYFGDGGAATDALLYAPSAVTLAPNGDLFIADAGNHRVRRVESGSGVITTVLGDGVAASSGEGAPADTFPVDDPQGLACDAFGNLFVSSSTTVRFLPATDDHVVDGTGPVQTIYGAAPRDTFPALATSCLTGVAVVDATTTWVTDRCAGLLVELWRQPTP